MPLWRITAQAPDGSAGDSPIIEAPTAAEAEAMYRLVGTYPVLAVTRADGATPSTLPAGLMPSNPADVHASDLGLPTGEPS